MRFRLISQVSGPGLVGQVWIRPRWRWTQSQIRHALLHGAWVVCWWGCALLPIRHLGAWLRPVWDGHRQTSICCQLASRLDLGDSGGTTSQRGRLLRYVQWFAFQIVGEGSCQANFLGTPSQTPILDKGNQPSQTSEAACFRKLSEVGQRN